MTARASGDCSGALPWWLPCQGPAEKWLGDMLVAHLSTYFSPDSISCCCRLDPSPGPFSSCLFWPLTGKVAGPSPAPSPCLRKSDAADSPAASSLVFLPAGPIQGQHHWVLPGGQGSTCHTGPQTSGWGPRLQHHSYSAERPARGDGTAA